MKHIKHTLLIALFSAVNFVAVAESFQPQIIKGRIIEKGTGMPVSNYHLWVRFFSGDGFWWSDTVATSESGEFTITNLSDQASSCEIEFRFSEDRYHESLFSGPFEPGLNNWGTLELSVRPFYFENCRQQSNMVSATVVNTTGKKAYMRFWLTGQLTRLDDSEYLGCNSEVLLKLIGNNKGPTDDYVTYRLVPGKNTVQLHIKDYGPDLSVSGIMISGGRSCSEPMMPSSHVLRQIWLPPITNTLPPIRITNLPPVLITNLPPIWSTNFPPLVPIPLPTNLPPYTTFSGSQASVWTWASRSP